MTLTALVGALVALVARPAKPQERPKHELEIERLNRRVETLEYDCACLERELAAERRLSTHWIGEASRFARQAREMREMWAQRERYQPMQDPRHAALYQQMQAQQLYNGLPPGAQAFQQVQQNQQNQQQAFGFCNCVPSRHQMFDAMVEQLNQLGR